MKSMQAIFLVFALAAMAQAETPPITIVVQEQPGLIEKGADLPYNRLLTLLLTGAKGIQNPEIFPGYRGVQGWLNKDYVCIFGGISSPGHKLPPKDTTITPADWDILKISKPYNRLKVRLISGQETPIAHSLDSVRNMAVAIDEVLYLDLGLHTDATRVTSPVRVRTPRQALDLLYSGRAPYALAYDNDVALYLQEHPEQTARFARELIVLELEESMMCWPGEAVTGFVNHIDKRLEDLRESGTLRDLVPSLY